jgi:hypothetical protein
MIFYNFINLSELLRSWLINFFGIADRFVMHLPSGEQNPIDGYKP